MKIAVTAEGPQLDSAIDSRFGRAKHFVLLDVETGEVTAHDNTQNLNAPQGAGIQAAQTVARLDAAVLLTGHVGPKAFATLQAAAIAVYTGATGTVREAIVNYQDGRLTIATQADVAGHWA